MAAKPRTSVTRKSNTISFKKETEKNYGGVESEVDAFAAVEIKPIIVIKAKTMSKQNSKRNNALKGMITPVIEEEASANGGTSMYQITLNPSAK